MPAPAANPVLRVYIGTYTGGASRGIYTAQFNTDTGELSTPELAVEAKNPAFLALHPTLHVLYAVNEMDNFGGQKAGAVSAFRMEEPTGRLTLLNQQPSSGTGPCHLSVGRSGGCVLVANYGSGSVAALPLRGDGQLADAGTSIQHQGSSVNRQRQAGPHAHFILPAPGNQFALACDLGLDNVLVYRLKSAAPLLSPNDPPSATVKPGSGPRHLAFHPNGRFVYLINELSSTLTAFFYEARTGTLKELQTVSTLPDDFSGMNTCAEVQVHPSGKFVYGSNRGDNSIAGFAVDPVSGKLTFLERQPTEGKTPRHFALDPTGAWLLAENQDSNSIVVFRLNAQTGRLTSTGRKTQLGSPVCLVFMPAQ
jgi:6-phosphogluconolactonase